MGIFVETDRMFRCERCSRQVRVCRRCDHGQRYRRQGCTQRARRDSQRRAGVRYQGSFRGRLFHARRQCRYRARQREKVTHQGFSEAIGLVNRVMEPAELMAAASALAGEIAVLPNGMTEMSKRQFLAEHPALFVEE